MIAKFCNLLLLSLFWLLPDSIRSHIHLSQDNVFVLGVWITPLVLMLYYAFVERCRRFDVYKIQPHKLNEHEHVLLSNITIHLLCLQSLATIVYALALRDSIESQTRQVEVPTLVETNTHLLLGIGFNEVYFYIMHRLSHRYFYRFHKIHHEFTAPVALSALHGSQLDLVTTTLPMVLAPMYVLNMKHYTSLLWLIMGVSHSYYEHCGYDLPFQLQVVPFASTPRVHDKHHQLTHCNYGLCYTFLDRLFNTLKN